MAGLTRFAAAWDWNEKKEEMLCELLQYQKKRKYVQERKNF